MSFIGLAIFAGSLLAGSMLLTWAVLLYLRRRAIFDTPNHRSSHTVPTPRGGGLATTSLLVVMVAAVFWAFGITAWQYWLMLAAAAGLGALSWLDDRFDLSARSRFACQFIAVIIGVFALQGPVFQGVLPFWLDRIVVVFGWVWFINLFNFMDGIDGISGVEAGSIGLGLFLLMMLIPVPGLMISGYIGLGILAIMIGFLIWNWHPAKLFMGDVGSVPLGFVLGWVLLDLAGRGGWPVAVILPAYYLFDATFTLIKRALRKEKVWQAHREHFYQRATQRGLSHSCVALMILVANLALIAVALAPADIGMWGRLAGAVVIVLALIAVMKFWPVPQKVTDKG